MLQVGTKSNQQFQIFSNTKVVTVFLKVADNASEERETFKLIYSEIKRFPE